MQINTHRSTTTTPEVVLEQDTRGNDINSVINYRVGVLHYRYQNYTRFVQLWAPKTFNGKTNFQTAGPKCRVNFGFRKVDIDNFGKKTKCTINQDIDYPLAAQGEGTTQKVHRFDFFDIYHWSRRWWDQYDTFWIFEIELKNPPQAMWTDNWEVRAYDNYDGVTLPAINGVNFTRI